MSTAAAPGVPFGTKIHETARENPEGTAVLFVGDDGSERTLTFGALDLQSTQLAHALVARGLAPGATAVVNMPNSPEHLIATFAAWKVGAVVVPMRSNLPEWERERVIAAVRPDVIIDAHATELFAVAALASTIPLPEAIAPHAWGICSSGSTGAPKVIMMNGPGLFVEGPSVAAAVESYGPLPEPQRVLIPAPLYHSNGFTATRNLMAGLEIVLMERFDAGRVLDVIARHRVTGFVGASPMLQRLVQESEIDNCDLSSLDWVQQGAAPLPVWLGRRWCELVGPEHFFVTYGASERHGMTCCRGDEWLEHPGTVGHSYGATEIKIIDDDGTELPTGEVGGIYLRKPGGPDASYVGADVTPLVSTDDGFVTVGDLGWLDTEGYLYLADRRVDMIVTGGVNVFPAEVEAALSEHPGVADVVVVGLLDPEWGRRVHAIIQPSNPRHPLESDDVIAFAKARLAAYKVPKSVELVDVMPRNEIMKINRAALTAIRDGHQSGSNPMDASDSA